MSQSAQVAPFDDYYQWDNSSGNYVIHQADVMKWNSYLGGVYQQAVSGLVYVANDVYQGTSGHFNIYGMFPLGGNFSTANGQALKSGRTPTIETLVTLRGSLAVSHRGPCTPEQRERTIGPKLASV